MLPTSYLLRGGHIYSPADPFATAMLVIDGSIAWIGSDAGADVHSDSVDSVIDLDGALVTPAFVDAHVHTTALGLSLTGLDLSQAVGPTDVLSRLQQFCDDLPAGAVVWGHGWDETRGDIGQHVRRDDLDRVCAGRPCFLSRVDAHSALVSTALVNLVDGVEGFDGYSATGPVSRAANLALRTRALAELPQAQRTAAQQATLDHAAARGIASLHEMAGPGISSADDLASVLALGRSGGVEVIGYWGALLDVETAMQLGAQGCAGDLFVDGSFGSHTACLRVPYADDPTTTGAAYLDPDAITEHIVACTNQGLQAGFHVIGDAAMDAVIEGFRGAVQRVGGSDIRAAHHRLEHAEMLDAEHLAILAEYSISLSMQPVFDTTWGGPGGMYAQRLGEARAATLNPFATVSEQGIPLALGSDAPVTPLEPWEAVRGAAFHHREQHRISTRAAFSAHTRGGRRAARQLRTEPGVLTDGAPATYAIWEPSDLVVQAPDDRLAAWSTDPRSGTPGLPDLTPGTPAPRCLRTVRAGTLIFDRLGGENLGDLGGSS